MIDPYVVRVFLGCVTLLVGLVLVLRHLKAMRATNAEMQTWGAAVAEDIGRHNQRIKDVEQKLATTEERLQRIDTRTQRT